MSLSAHQPFFDAEDYLHWEAAQQERHEYIDGEVFALAQASARHATIARNLGTLLRQHLHGSPCTVFVSDMQVHVAPDSAFYYPDVFVTCSEADRQRSQFQCEPTLVVEVLAPATGAYDRGAKFSSYRKLPSLREYLLIDSERMAVDLCRHDVAERWSLYPLEAPEQQVELASLGLQVSLHALYEDVRWEASRSVAAASR